jgi:hypothetical protein
MRYDVAVHETMSARLNTRPSVGRAVDTLCRERQGRVDKAIRRPVNRWSAKKSEEKKWGSKFSHRLIEETAEQSGG